LCKKEEGERREGKYPRDRDKPKPTYKRPNPGNGHYSKTLNSPPGNIDVPRDGFSEFNPKLVPKGSKSLVEDLQNKLVLLYSRGLSTRDIQDRGCQLFQVKESLRSVELKHERSKACKKTA